MGRRSSGERRAIWLGALCIRGSHYAEMRALARALASTIGANLGELAEGGKEWTHPTTRAKSTGKLFDGTTDYETYTRLRDCMVQPLRPLRPAALYRAPLPRTKLEAVVPDGQVMNAMEGRGRKRDVDHPAAQHTAGVVG